MADVSLFKDRMILALDTPSLERTEELLKELQGFITFYKIGFELFTAHGWKAVELVRKYEARVFLDLKLHDIPNTAAKTIAVVCQHQIDMVNVHALGGFEMMKRVHETVQACVKLGQPRPIVIAVTVLTSLTNDILKNELGISRSVDKEVIALATLVKQSGLNGVVSSPQEIELLRKELPKDFVIVTPGIRMDDGSKDDQKRICTPKDAFNAGADYIIIGRPITEDPAPRLKAEAILKTLDS